MGWVESAVLARLNLRYAMGKVIIQLGIVLKKIETESHSVTQAGVQ